MEIDLTLLNEMHPKLPGDVLLAIVGRAALALERSGHKSGLAVSWQVQRSRIAGSLAWPASDTESIDQHDRHRITEDGAEAVALALAHRHAAWCVVRRLQREERADWLLTDPGKRLIALEVSGVDKGGIEARMMQKLTQVAASEDVHERWASVVGFEAPTAAMRSTARRRP